MKYRLFFLFSVKIENNMFSPTDKLKQADSVKAPDLRQMRVCLVLPESTEK